MEKELIIHSTQSEVEIALLEDGKLVELHHEETSNDFAVGDIFIGKIRKLMPGLNAAFVDIGHKKDAFLHYTDMGPKLKKCVKIHRQCYQRWHQHIESRPFQNRARHQQKRES